MDSSVNEKVQACCALYVKAIDISSESVGFDTEDAILDFWGVRKTLLKIESTFGRFANWEYPDPKKQPDYKLPVTFDVHWEKQFLWNVECALWAAVFNHHHFTLGNHKKGSSIADAAVKAWKS